MLLVICLIYTKTHESFYYLSLLILSLLNILFLLTGISNILINSSLTISVDLFSLINFERNSYSAFITTLCSSNLTSYLNCVLSLFCFANNSIELLVLPPIFSIASWIGSNSSLISFADISLNSNGISVTL